MDGSAGIADVTRAVVTFGYARPERSSAMCAIVHQVYCPSSVGGRFAVNVGMFPPVFVL